MAAKESFGTVDDYVKAFENARRKKIHPNTIALLRLHFKAPYHTATHEQLAKKIGYADYRGVNGANGRLGSQIGKALRMPAAPNPEGARKPF